MDKKIKIKIKLNKNFYKVLYDFLLESHGIDKVLVNGSVDRVMDELFGSEVQNYCKDFICQYKVIYLSLVLNCKIKCGEPYTFFNELWKGINFRSGSSSVFVHGDIVQRGNVLCFNGVEKNVRKVNLEELDFEGNFIYMKMLVRKDLLSGLHYSTHGEDKGQHIIKSLRGKNNLRDDSHDSEDSKFDFCEHENNCCVRPVDKNSLIFSFDIDAYYGMINFDKLDAFKRGIRIDICKKKIRNSVEMVYINGTMIQIKKSKYLHLGKYDTPVGAFSIFYVFGGAAHSNVESFISRVVKKIDNKRNVSKAWHDLYCSLVYDELSSTPFYLRGSVSFEILKEFFTECVRITCSDFLFFESYGNKKYTSNSNLFKSLEYIKEPFYLDKVAHMNVDTCINVMSSLDEFIFPEAKVFKSLGIKNNYRLFMCEKARNLNKKMVIKTDKGRTVLYKDGFIRKYNFYSCFEDAISGLYKGFKPKVTLEQIKYKLFDVGLVKPKSFKDFKRFKNGVKMISKYKNTPYRLEFSCPYRFAYDYCIQLVEKLSGFVKFDGESLNHMLYDSSRQIRSTFGAGNLTECFKSAVYENMFIHFFLKGDKNLHGIPRGIREGVNFCDSCVRTIQINEEINVDKKDQLTYIHKIFSRQVKLAKLVSKFDCVIDIASKDLKHGFSKYLDSYIEHFNKKYKKGYKTLKAVDGITFKDNMLFRDYFFNELINVKPGEVLPMYKLILYTMRREFVFDDDADFYYKIKDMFVKSSVEVAFIKARVYKLVYAESEVTVDELAPARDILKEVIKVEESGISLRFDRRCSKANEAWSDEDVVRVFYGLCCTQNGVTEMWKSEVFGIKYIRMVKDCINLVKNNQKSKKRVVRLSGNIRMFNPFDVNNNLSYVSENCGVTLSKEQMEAYKKVCEHALKSLPRLTPEQVTKNLSIVMKMDEADFLEEPGELIVSRKPRLIMTEGSSFVSTQESVESISDKVVAISEEGEVVSTNRLNMYDNSYNLDDNFSVEIDNNNNYDDYDDICEYPADPPGSVDDIVNDINLIDESVIEPVNLSMKDNNKGELAGSMCNILELESPIIRVNEELKNDSLKDRVLDIVINSGDEGISKRDIRRKFRKGKTSEIEDCLNNLVELGLILKEFTAVKTKKKVNRYKKKYNNDSKKELN